MMPPDNVRIDLNKTDENVIDGLNMSNGRAFSRLSIEEKDSNIAPPTPTKEMLYGLAGKVGTESA